MRSGKTWGELFEKAAEIAKTADHVKKKTMEYGKGNTITGCDIIGALTIAAYTVKVARPFRVGELLTYMLGVEPGVWNDRAETTKEHVVAFYEKAALVYKDV